MRKLLLVVCLASALGTSAYAAERPVSQQQLEALESRIARLEADAQVLRKQSVDALAQAQAAQAELARLKPAATAPAIAEASESVAAADDLAAAPDDLAATPSPTTETLAAAADAGQGGSAANAFNPAISIILNGSYSHHSLDPDAYARAGFPLVGGAGPGANGFSLGESEISLAASIDDKLYGQLTLAVGNESGDIGVEEAFIDTTSLPGGFSLRAGRFFSNIGYLNSHHAHSDNFFDRPLAYQAFVANQYGDDGVQLRWVAPTALYLEVGAEAFRGQSFPSAGATHGGVGAKTAFAHVGGDVGVENSWLAGVSVLKSSAVGAEDGFSGDSTLYLADGTWKWAPQGNFKDGGVTVRGEYFLDRRDGAVVDPADPGLSTLWNGQRRGAYLETVYRLNRTWDVGYRFDKLWADADGPFATAGGSQGFDPWRHSAELTWRNSEFSLVRLQVSHDKPNASDSDNAVTLQYQTSLGAHGAHKF